MYVVLSPSFHWTSLGVPGVKGTDGLPGRDGTDGVPGVDGSPGPTGKMTHCYTVEIKHKPVNNWFPLLLHQHLWGDLDDPGPSGKSSHEVM